MEVELNYVKTVLHNVSFDSTLFNKELKKATTTLLPYDLERLHQWVGEYVEMKPELKESIEFSL
ncbi:MULTISPECIES: hypothetical protein [Myroides]|uniref:Uncharacterized protein n=1 Tax=Myroides albus TaxID=2562892 RepID=A0A6I3LL70_9FLAO|nr:MULTISPECIES: hypothetical protein [Myroides]MTG98594.1 hypothetical protein [Myroides albus]MVX36626.1 hypothetical protein [Myroides sp. LoEW2-1]UVD79964.1 hypothetical protein NWE55_01340 [Myroides albus]